MKIGIITIHFGTNYGSALQTYALSNYIKENLCVLPTDEVEVINYIPSRYSKMRRYLHMGRKMSFVKRIAYSILTAPSLFIYHKIFNDFLTRYTPLGKEYGNIGDLRARYSNYELLITGSDQVWNSDYNEGFNGAYFLNFASPDSIKISYAASGGKIAYDLSETKMMKESLESFSGISVREKQLRDLLLKMGFKNTKLVLDPVFLFDKKRWAQLAGTPLIKEHYLFIYILDGDTGNTIDTAVEIAKKLSLKTVLVSFGHVWSHDNRVDYYLIRKSPADFINLIINSEYVVTNSFHGVAFSINLNKQFLAFKREKYNSRLDSIAELFHLEDRFTSSKESLNVEKLIGDKIDYNIVNDMITKLRILSTEYLTEMVGRINEKSL